MTMTRIAITGGIGSGKSFVCRLLERRGIKIYDCDSAAKRIMITSPEVIKALTALIGSSAYVDGKINKPVLAEYLLASADNANRINSIVHPAVAADFMSSDYNWMECAILFTSGFDSYADRVICVTAPRNLRIDRIMRRDSITKQKAEEWIDCQMSQDDVVRRSDFEIVNDGIQALEPQIDRILRLLK